MERNNTYMEYVRIKLFRVFIKDYNNDDDNRDSSIEV